MNGQTHTAASPAITAAPVLTIGGSTFAPTNGPTYQIGSQSLTPGGIITFKGTTVSLGPGASSIVVNGLTQNLKPAHPASVTAAPVLTVGGDRFTALNEGSTYVINGQSLTPGEMETVSLSGTTYIVSLASGATVVVVETLGSNGQVTATNTQTIYPPQASQGTITDTVSVSASAGSMPPSGPSASSQGVRLSNDATSVSLRVGGVCISLGTLALALWL